MLAPAIGAWALIIAAAVGAMIRKGTGDGGSCDRPALAAALANGISVADQRGQAQFDVVRPVDCTEGDLAAIVPAVTRKWHMMPGGTMMREPSHIAPTP